MIALSCGILVLCVLVLMINTGVGPFVNPPWLRLHLAFTALSSAIKIPVNLLAILGALVCTLILIGAI
jgi:hypothetical protein